MCVFPTTELSTVSIERRMRLRSIFGSRKMILVSSPRWMPRSSSSLWGWRGRGRHNSCRRRRARRSCTFQVLQRAPITTLQRWARQRRRCCAVVAVAVAPGRVDCVPNQAPLQGHLLGLSDCLRIPPPAGAAALWWWWRARRGPNVPVAAMRGAC